jgi:DNA-binding transcriptional LysR family regulator
MNNEIDLNLLIVFDAVWRHRRISRAAIELNTSQPTVSNALRRLRASTGDALFVRSGSGMEPTPFAERLATHWCNGLSAVRRGLAMRSDFDIATDKRTFTIVMSDIAEAVILPHVLNACRKTAPGIFFSAIQLPMEQILPALRTGAVDLAVGFIPELRSGVRQQLLFESDYVALARRGHPGVKQSAMSKVTFLKQRHALAKAEGTGHAIVERTLRKHGLDANIAVRVPHFLALPMIVGSSDLVATVPRPLGVLLADAAPIAILPHPLKLPKLVIRQFWHERFDAEPAVMWLRKTLRAAIADASQLRSPSGN